MRRMIALTLCLCSMMFPACTRAPAMNSVVGYYFDTVITITADCDTELLTSCLDLCERYESLFSRTVNGSDVWKINHANGNTVTVDAETAELLKLALGICSASEGAFDITVAPAVELWDFNAAQPTVPDADLLRSAVQKIDYTKVQVNDRSVTLPADMQVDLGGIAKGYVADRIKEYLIGSGVRSACINLGGNVLTLGAKPDGTPWRIGIRDANGEESDCIEVLDCVDTAVVTSGDYERCFVLDGVRYHHILDPKSGMPINNGVASVTILADSATIADALSTACFLMGEEDGTEFAKKFNATAKYQSYLYGDQR